MTLIIEVPDLGEIEAPDEFEQWDEPQRLEFIAQARRAADISPVGEFFRGVGRGAIEGTVGAAEMAGRGFTDIGQTAVAAGRAALDPDKDFQDYLLELDLASRDNLTSDVARDLIPAGDPTSLAARAGEITGGLVAGPVATVGAARVVPQAVRAASPAVRTSQALISTPVRSSLAAGITGGASAGAGELAAEQFGEGARPIAELATGVGLPTVAQKARDLAVRYAVGAAPGTQEIRRSGEIFQAQEAEGIQPSAGSIGNPRAAYLETTGTALPLAGGRLGRRMGEQVEQGRANLDEFTTELRPPSAGPAREGVPGQADIGAQLRDAAETALVRIERFLGGAEESITRRAGGPDTPVTPSATRERLRDVARREATAEETTGAARTFEQELVSDIDRQRPGPGQALTPAEGLLRTDLAAVERQLANVQRNRPGSAQAQRLQARADDLRQRIEAEQTVPLQQFRERRTMLGPRTQQQRSMGRGVSKQLYTAMTDDLERTIGEAGPEVLQDFRRLMNLEQRLYRRRGSLAEGRDIEQLRKLVDTADDQAIYRWISQGQALPAEKFQLLKRNMNPARWQRFASDFVARMGHAAPGAQSATDELFSPAVFMTNFNRMGPDVRDLLLPPDAVDRLERLANAMEGLQVRQSRGNPSGTAMTAIPVGVAHNIFGRQSTGEGMTDTLRRLASYTLGSTLYAAGLLDRRTAQALAGRLPPLGQEVGVRAARVAPAVAGTEQDETSP